MMNSIVNRIVSSNKLFTVTVLLSIVACVCLNGSVESRPRSTNKFTDVKKDQLNSNAITDPPNQPTSSISDRRFDNAESNSTVDWPSNATHASNKTELLVNNDPRSYRPDQEFYNKFISNRYDYAFFFRLLVFISAFCFVIIASIYIKSLNTTSIMYNYLDTRCGDEEKLMKYNGEYVWDVSVCLDVWML